MELLSGPGRFDKGDIHTHSTASDAVRDPETTGATYRGVGYDFLALTDHFLPRFGFPITDTRAFRTNRFTTILGAEVHALRTELGEMWPILSAGLPLDFAHTPPDEAAADLPASATARVLCGGGTLVDAVRPRRVHHLLTHASGLTDGPRSPHGGGRRLHGQAPREMRLCRLVRPFILLSRSRP